MENNENSTQTTNTKNKGISIGSLIALVIFLVCMFNVVVKPAIEVPKTAKAHVKQEVMSELGVVATNFSTDTIYKSGKDKLVVVKYGLDSSGYDGSMCVYFKENRYYSSTSIMPVDYEWRSNIEAVKAYFGLY